MTEDPKPEEPSGWPKTAGESTGQTPEPWWIDIGGGTPVMSDQAGKMTLAEASEVVAPIVALLTGRQPSEWDIYDRGLVEDMNPAESTPAQQLARMVAYYHHIDDNLHARLSSLDQSTRKVQTTVRLLLGSVVEALEETIASGKPIDEVLIRSLERRVIRDRLWNMSYNDSERWPLWASSDGTLVAVDPDLAIFIAAMLGTASAGRLARRLDSEETS